MTTTSIEQYTLINGKTERVILEEAFTFFVADRGVKAAFGRSLANGKGMRIWVDGEQVHHSFQDAYQGGWSRADHLYYNLPIEVSPDVKAEQVAADLRGFGLDASVAAESNTVWVKAHLTATQRYHLECWAKAVDLRASIVETRASIRDNAQFLTNCWDIAVCYSDRRDGNEVGQTTRRLSDLSNTLWYAEQEAHKTYFYVRPEGYDWENDEQYKYGVARLAAMSAEEVIAL